MFESLATACRKTGLWEPPALVSLSAILLEQGSVEEAEQVIMSILPSTEPNTLYHGLLCANLAEVQARQGDGPRARAHIEQAVRMTIGRRGGIFVLRVTLTKARVLAELGELEAAQRTLHTAGMLMEEEGVGEPSFLMRHFRSSQALTYKQARQSTPQ